MKKAGQLLAVLTAASVLLSGCEKLKDVTTTSVYVSKNGVVTEAIVEDYSKDDDYTEDELKGLLTRLLRILEYLHASHIYHRDIKPGNILLTEEGTPVLIDFGAARHALKLHTATWRKSGILIDAEAGFFSRLLAGAVSIPARLCLVVQENMIGCN